MKTLFICISAISVLINPVFASDKITSGGGGKLLSSKWPKGIPPGNLYLVVMKSVQWGGEVYEGKMLVSGKDSEEVIGNLNERWRVEANSKRSSNPQYADLLLKTHFLIEKECKGANWGAVVIASGTLGADCGYSSPEMAIRSVYQQRCQNQTDQGCSNPAKSDGTFGIDLAHSGASVRATQADIDHISTWPDFPTPRIAFNKFYATTSGFYGMSFRSIDEAINSIDKGCNGVPCYQTSFNARCIGETSGSTEGCVDPRFTKNGLK